MRADEIAERHAVQPGYRLVDYMEVGLPVYYVVLQASTLLRKKTPPLEEFVMRSLKLGMQDCQEISGFLGLEIQTVEGIVVSLIQGNNVSLAGIEGGHDQALRLTVKGLKTLEDLELVVPEEKTIFLYFDALLRRPAFYREELLKYRQLVGEGLKEIPAIPARQPKPDDFPINLVQDLIKNRMGAGEKRDLLSIKRVERCSRLFRRAVALLFCSLESNQLHVEFMVDGKPTSEYDLAFAKADGLKLLGVDTSNMNDGVPTSASDEAHLSPQSGEFVPMAQETIKEEAEAVLKAKAKVKQTENAIEHTTDPTTRQVLQNELGRANAQLSQLMAEVKRRRVRQVYVYEHPRLLDRALNSCQERLMIISPWIRAQVVDREFLGKLKGAIKRQVKVYIGYGISDDDPKEFRKSDKYAEGKLAALAKRYPNFVFQRFGDTHAKVLICDSKFCITGSFNWLSFRGDPDRTFRDEQSVLVEIPEHVDGVFRENLKRFTAQPSAHNKL